MRKERLYIAYGSNLSMPQMDGRCPTAEVVGKTTLRGWSLWFMGRQRDAVATIKRERGGIVPVLIWKLQPLDEAALDRYEGYPYFYHKESLRITVNGHRHSAMVYIMNDQHGQYGIPSERYYGTILKGYEDAGFDSKILENALSKSKEAAGWTKE